MTVEEFFHYYCPSEIVQSKGVYGILPWKPSLRLVYDTPDSNRNRKSQYFFLEGDDWMCHEYDQEFMPVDKTWRIMPPSVKCLLAINRIFNFYIMY